MKWQDSEKKMHEAVGSGNWDEAIAHAKNVPATMNSFETMPSQNMPAHAMHKVVDYLSSLPDNYSHGQNKAGFAFEAASNLPPDADMSLLKKIYELSPNDWHVTNNLLSHPNLKYEGRDALLNEGQKYFQGYEEKVEPHHFATIKSLFSGKPERIKDHRNSEGISNPDVIPGIKEHASEIQKKILNDKEIPKRYFGKEPYIKLYRGVNGSYGKAIRDKAEFNPKEGSVKKKTFTVPTASFSSWTSDPEMAGRFSWGRGNIEGQPDYAGAVMSQWHPIKSVLHSSMHNSILAPKSKQTDESEIIIGHPEGKMKINTSDMHFQPEPDFSYNKRNNIPVTPDSTPDNYGTMLKPTLKKSEDLEKDRGRITFPADPKITNRPDMKIKDLDPQSPLSVKANVKRMMNVAGNVPENIKGKDNYFSSLSDVAQKEKIKGVIMPSSKEGHEAKGWVKGANTPTREHEGGHWLFKEIERVHGPKTKSDFLSHLHQTIHPDVKDSLDTYLQSTPTYRSLISQGQAGQDRYKEEILNHLRDYSTNPEKRNLILWDNLEGNMDQTSLRSLDNKYKSSWNDVVRASNNFKLPVTKNDKDLFISEAVFDFMYNSGLEVEYSSDGFLDFKKMPINEKLTLYSDTYKLEPTLMKSIKHNAIAAATAAAMIGSPIHPDSGMDLKDLNNQAQSVKAIHSKKESQIHPDLQHIKMIESNGGKNLKHDLITEGLSAGSHAYGKFGLTNLRMLETVKADRHLRIQHPEFLKFHHINDEDKIHDYVAKNKGMEEAIANSHWHTLDKKFEGDKNKMAYAWLHGVTGAINADEGKIQNSDYVQKFNKYQKLNSLQTHFNKSETDIDIKKNNIKSFNGVLNKPEDASDVYRINESIKSRQIHDLSNHGHFTHSSFVVGLNKDNSWLIKVDQKVRSSIESLKYGLQSVKEAAFYEAARNVFGLAEFTPKAILGELEVDGEKKTCVAIRMYGDVYIQAVEYKKQDPNGLVRVIDQYVEYGTLHKLAAMFWILGDLDCHGKNMLTNGKDMKLIDHGSSFADSKMNVKDEGAFIPYFLRAWGGVKDSMTDEEKLERMPKVLDQKANIELQHWLASLDVQKMVEIITKHKLDKASAVRLESLRRLVSKRPDSNISVIINELWVEDFLKMNKEANYEA